MYRLTTEQVIAMHSELIKYTGGNTGIRDNGLLDSAVNAPFQSFGNQDVYPDIYHKAARLGFGLSQNHAFVDGNKRIAAHALLVFLSLNGIEINCTELELFSLFIGLANSEVTYDELVEWIRDHSLTTEEKY